MIPIAHYGLHRQDSFVFLHEQAGASRCLNTGLSRLPSPFVLGIKGYHRCPHMLGDPEPGPIIDHPFVRAMGPDQEAGLFYVREEHAAWIWRLSAMIPTTERIIENYQSLRWPRLSKASLKLTLTNAAPQVFVDVGVENFGDIERLARMHRTRNLIICGPIRLASAVQLDPAGLEMDHDWAAEGRRQLHHFVRRLS